jgi:hypothetical protein
MRAAGKTPSWDNYVAEGTMRGLNLDPVQVEEYERLWRIIFQLCPKSHDSRVTDYLLVCLAHEQKAGIEPNPTAFELEPAEAQLIHKAIEANS